MKIFRLCTEARNESEIEAAAAVLFEGFSIFRGTGYWRGTREQSLMMEVFVDDNPAGVALARARVRSLAATIRDFNKQECVLVQELDCEGEFV